MSNILVAINLKIKNNQLILQATDSNRLARKIIEVKSDKEVEANTVSIRSREEGDIGAKSVEDFTTEILKKIEEKS